jgi:phosphoribosyl-AMP cyclohydrolase
MGVNLDEDLFALSEMIQFIWRSRIREGKPIDLFVPSGRMRTILKAWLDCQEDPLETTVEKAGTKKMVHRFHNSLKSEQI